MNDQERLTALQKLRDPFPEEAIGHLPKGGTQLSYVGHANVTDRLLSTDPSWTWEPLATDPEGLPVFDRDQQGRPVGLWIKLTICGVTRLGYGSVAPGAFDAVKQLIGDALRNGAMRFGVALQLWSKEEFEGVAGNVSPQIQVQQSGAVTAPPQPSDGGAEVLGAQSSPVSSNEKGEFLGLIEARIKSGDLEWNQVRGKAKVEAARRGEAPPSSQSGLKNLSTETLRVLVGNL